MAPEHYRNQDYYKLQKQSLKSGQLFTDPEFPAENSSLFFDPNKNVYGGVEWKRPGDISSNPKLFVDGTGKDDVNQGALGNCWFVSACSAITHHKSFMNKVIPNKSDQEWDSSKPEKYAGIFHFKFWRAGQWIDVVIDDLLPYQDGKLIFAHSKTKNEFWCALLEKAFAKLSGSYEGLIGGSLSEALMDMSGGVPENISLTDVKNWDERSRLFDSVKASSDKKSLMAAAIAVEDKKEIEDQQKNGLVKGHSYAITAVKHIELDSDNQGLMSVFTQNEKIMMVRLQNPWGAKEWNGPWSDGAPEWEKVSESQRKDLGLTFDEDGEFWMTWEDFCNNFTEISICHLYNTSMWSFSKQYAEERVNGAWTAHKERGHPNDRAGGCLNFKATCLSNPQYSFEITNESDTVIISLSQKDIRARRKAAENFYMTIGISVLRVEKNRKYRVHEIMPKVGTSTYSNRRSEFLKLPDLPKGRYVIIPSTYAAGEEGEFFMRVYTSSNSYLKELTKHVPSGGCCKCCKPNLACVTRIKVLAAKDLKNLKTGDKDVDAYCIVTCEKETVKTEWKGKNSNPKWDEWAVFWRRKPSSPIKIEIYDANYLRDSFLGMVTIMASVSNDTKRMEIPVEDKTGTKQKGQLILEVATYDDPMYL